MDTFRILVAEDDALVAEDLKQTLEDMGHTVVGVAHDALQAQGMARLLAPDLAVLDVRMPGAADGIDVGRELKEEFDLPIVFLTAYGDDGTVSRALEVEPGGYLVKPVDPVQLRLVIQLAMERHRYERRLRDAAQRARRAESAMRVSETRYRMLFHASPGAIHTVRAADGVVLDVNRRFEELFGQRRAHVVGSTTDALDVWPDASERARLAERFAADEEVRDLRVHTSAPGRGELHLDVAVQPVELEGERALIVISSDVTDRVALEADLQRRALYDPLTGLPNRTLFRDRLTHSLERGRREEREVAVLFIDLDHFKDVNDTLGHASGDRVLAAAAGRLASCLRKEDTVARLGGDEFGAVLVVSPGGEEASAAAERIADALATPFLEAGREVSLGASIGIALTGARSADEADLLRWSDAAMYAAKADGGSRYRFYDDGPTPPEAVRSETTAGDHAGA